MAFCIHNRRSHKESTASYNHRARYAQQRKYALGVREMKKTGNRYTQEHPPYYLKFMENVSGN